MSSYTRAPFTVSAGLTIQREQLAHWKRLLNEAAYRELQAFADKANSNLRADATGYDVARGGDLDSFVHNLWL